MPEANKSLTDRLVHFTPFDLLSEEDGAALAGAIEEVQVDAGTLIFQQGANLAGLYVVEAGSVEVRTRDGDVVSHRGPGDVMGERGLLRDGRAILSAHAVQLELSQVTYMQEEPPYPFLEEQAGTIRPVLRRLIETMLDWKPSG